MAAHDIVIFRQIGLPLFQNTVYATPEAARSAPTGDVELGQCASPGLVHNRPLSPEFMVYDTDYQNEQAFSQEHLLDVLRIVRPHAKIYIEVPCFDWIASQRAFYDIFYEVAA